ncbi:Hypothetical predicted protein [Cloeon dipterum]|uniref:Uncharacterized protein n=1 Tax=Cloeon dipterum TaxID=197152 RepID=A0A8S1D1N0_9INSE|nr:Hypothetical predicted protein [Cloeon dipterum]
MDVEEDYDDIIGARESLQRILDIVKDDSVSASSKEKCSVSETIKLAQKFQDTGVENLGRPFVSLECMTDFFMRNKKLDPILANVDSSTSVDPTLMSEYLWHNFHKRAAAGHFLPSSKITKMVRPEKREVSPFETVVVEDAWTKIEDLPLFAKEPGLKELEKEEEMEVMDSNNYLDSQSAEDEKVSVAEFLAQCQESKSGTFPPEFFSKLCSQPESNLLTLFASCSNSDLFIPLLLHCATENIKLLIPLCEKILLPLSRRDGFDTTIISKTCTLMISHPLLVSTHLLVPLARDDSSGKALSIKLTNLCENEEVRHTFLTCLLNSDWTARKGDLELLQCLLGSSIPRNAVIVQLVCQMFRDADAELKSSSDFAKLLLQAIKTLKGDLTEECRILLRAAVAEIKSPLRGLMEKHLR